MSNAFTSIDVLVPGRTSRLHVGIIEGSIILELIVPAAGAAADQRSFHHGLEPAVARGLARSLLALANEVEASRRSLNSER